MKLLIANRGECALRIQSCATTLGISCVSICSTHDHRCKHALFAECLVVLQGSHPLLPYLDEAQLIAVAKQYGCNAVHPGYGFLSESAQFARALKKAGIEFVGPSPDTLERCGSKVQARRVAAENGIPIVRGTSGGIEKMDTHDIHQMVKKHQLQYPIMLKAVAGGGGKGSRIVNTPEELQPLVKECHAEAKAAFGNGEVFMEQMIQRAKHIEVQIIGDQHGNIVALGERDCSVQLKHQKVIEFASSHVSEKIRKAIIQDALKLAKALDYVSAGTFEFLIDQDGRHYFMECNPRLQVEHTVTEQAFGVDIVQMQLRIMQGATLAELKLNKTLTPRYYSIQARINVLRVGVITAYNEPSGIGIRVESHGYVNYETVPFFDQLLAKIIVTADSFVAATEHLKRALLAFYAEGIETNVSLILNVLSSSDFVNNTIYTTYLSEHIDQLNKSNPLVEAAMLRFRDATGFAKNAAVNELSTKETDVVIDGHPIRTSLSALVVDVTVKVGDGVQPGDSLLTLNAMKMHSVIRADRAGVVKQIFVQPNDAVRSDQVLLTLNTDETAIRAAQRLGSVAKHLAIKHSDWSDELKKLSHYKSIIQKMGGEESLAKQRAKGKKNARERIAMLLDPESFEEIGSVAGSAVWDKKDPSKLLSLTAANMVCGTGRIAGSPVAVTSDDFSIRGGHSDGAIWRKAVYTEQMARDMRIPLVRILDGSSGGGSVASLLKLGYNYVPPLPGFKVSVPLLAEVPVCTVAAGSVVGLGAAKLCTAHFSIFIKGISQVFVAGSVVVAPAYGNDRPSNEELGGFNIHSKNGVIDNIAVSEEDAYQQVRRFLSYMPINAWHLATRAASSDLPTRREDELLSIIPKQRNMTYSIRHLIKLIVDLHSFFEIGATWGKPACVGLARLDGWAIGVISNDPEQEGGAVTAAAAQKFRRFIEMCYAFHIPILSLCDNPGFGVGRENESQGTIKFAAQLMNTLLLTASLPFYTVIIRRSFGVAGAAFCDRSEPNNRVAWPSMDSGSLPLEGGLHAAFKSMLSGVPDPVSAEKELLAQFDAIRDPIRNAIAFDAEEMIDPRDTRRLACRWVELAYHKLRSSNIAPLPNGYRL